MNQSILDLIETEADIWDSYNDLRVTHIFHPGQVKQEHLDAFEVDLKGIRSEIARLTDYVSEGV